MEWFLFSPLPGTPGHQRERVSPTPYFQVFFRKGRERVSCAPWPQLYNKFARKLITDGFNGGVAEQTRKNIIQPYCMCFQEWPTKDILGVVQLLWYFPKYSPSINQPEYQGGPESEMVPPKLVLLDRLFFHEFDQSAVEIMQTFDICRIFQGTPQPSWMFCEEVILTVSHSNLKCSTGQFLVLILNRQWTVLQPTYFTGFQHTSSISHLFQQSCGRNSNIFNCSSCSGEWHISSAVPDDCSVFPPLLLLLLFFIYFL